jgi:hypothetical protein
MASNHEKHEATVELFADRLGLLDGPTVRHPLRDRLGREYQVRGRTTERGIRGRRVAIHDVQSPQLVAMWKPDMSVVERGFRVSPAALARIKRAGFDYDGGRLLDGGPGIEDITNDLVNPASDPRGTVATRVVHDRVRTERGEVLKADFSVAPEDDSFALIIESRGGALTSPAPRNPDYHKAMRLLLERLATAGASLQDATVESKEVAALPHLEKALDLGKPYPIAIAGEDGEDLRLRIGRAQGRIGRLAGAPRGRNSVKRTRLRVQMPGSEWTTARLRELLVFGDGAIESDSGAEDEELDLTIKTRPIPDTVASLAEDAHKNRGDPAVTRILMEKANQEHHALLTQIRDLFLTASDSFEGSKISVDGLGGWKDLTVIVEVKSSTRKPSAQIRRAVGQLLEYAYVLRRDNKLAKDVALIVAIPKRPNQPTWLVHYLIADRGMNLVYRVGGGGLAVVGPQAAELAARVRDLRVGRPVAVPAAFE